jgi:steroid delta-isomerase-like uncharacterized protein
MMPRSFPRPKALLPPILLSLMMSGLVTFVAILRMSGALPGFEAWFSSWMSAWIVAFPALLIAQPIVTQAIRLMDAISRSNRLHKESTNMTTTTTKDATQTSRMDALNRFYDAFATGNGAELDHALTADWDEEPRNPGQEAGREPMKQFVAGVRQALPDMTIEIKDVVFGEDKVAVRAEMRGTHTKDFFGIAATGKSYVIRLHEFHSFEGSQIAFTWHMEDWFGFLNQIGAWPVATGDTEK